jgi:glycosyltransferase involved in cell wall biosynthesis
MIWFLRNVSILLENAPLVRTMAGSILVHAQKPPRMRARRRVSLSVHNSLRDSVSVVIPCHNEEMNIRPLVKGLSELYGEYVHEFILLDDGSTDRTREVISALARENARVHPVYRGPPHGVGRAIADGLAVAKGHYVLTIDCDFQHLLPEFRDLFESVAEGYDVVIGSRFSRHSVLLGYPFLKILANRAFHTATDILFWRRLRDLTNNLKIMRIEVAHRMILRQPGFAVNAETGLEPVLLGYRVKLVPISWINRTPGMGTSSFRLRQVGKGYWSVLSGLWWWYYFGTGPYAKLGRPACEPEHLPGKIAREQRSAP